MVFVHKSPAGSGHPKPAVLRALEGGPGAEGAGPAAAVALDVLKAENLASR